MTEPTTREHHFPAGSLAAAGASVVLTPATAGWTYSSLRVLDLTAGERVVLDSGDEEFVLLPLSVRDVDVAVTVGDDPSVHDFTLTGRGSVFTGVSDFCYVGRGSRVAIRATGDVGGRLAVTGARCERAFPPRHQPADAVPVELRGAGACSRQVNNFAAAGVFDADRLIAVEVLTPGGNWSSYPPHKHDEDVAGEESVLEEIYYYEIDVPAAADGVGPGVGYQRVYGTDDRPIDVLAEVRTGDVVAMPHGWHGPSMASPGYDMYYLNVMAGPSAERAWLIRDDPERAWIRGTWADQPVDPRLPLTGPDAVATPTPQQRGESG